MKIKLVTSALSLASLLCLVQPAQAEWVRRITDGIMGTRITVELWTDDKDKAEQAIDAVLDEMRHIDDSMSTYKPTSEVSQVNAKAADGPMPITKELFDLLTTAKEYSVLTEERSTLRMPASGTCTISASMCGPTRRRSPARCPP